MLPRTALAPLALAFLGILTACSPAAQPTATATPATPTPTATGTPPTPTATPAPRLDFTVRVTPESPRVGDHVTVSVTARGNGGLPANTLDLDHGPLPLQSERHVTFNQLGLEAGWTLTAVQPGTAAFTVSVHYETKGVDTRGEMIWYFTSAQTDRYTVTMLQP